MKTGDLVTISAYGRRLVSLSDEITRRNCALKKTLNPQNPQTVPDEQLPALIGIVTKIWKGSYQRSSLHYSVCWAGEGIPGRSRWDRSFTRKDLKMVSKS